MNLTEKRKEQEQHEAAAWAAWCHHNGLCPSCNPTIPQPGLRNRCDFGVRIFGRWLEAYQALGSTET